ncbi:hypothetical protein C8F01DRAFT_1083790 [Mycena amicta]|nr:hypothetical protein C8F01DRAFT_1083790 [Mycena amicta]
MPATRSLSLRVDPSRVSNLLVPFATYSADMCFRTQMAWNARKARIWWAEYIGTSCLQRTSIPFIISTVAPSLPLAWLATSSMEDEPSISESGLLSNVVLDYGACLFPFAMLARTDVCSVPASNQVLSSLSALNEDARRSSSTLAMDERRMALNYLCSPCIFGSVLPSTLGFSDHAVTTALQHRNAERMTTGLKIDEPHVGAGYLGERLMGTAWGWSWAVVTSRYTVHVVVYGEYYYFHSN